MHEPYHHHHPPRPWLWARQDPAPPGWMRVSNAERTEVTNALVRHYADGRLDDAELEERMAKATAAKTRDDLAPLLADLPRLVDPDPPPPPRALAPVFWVVAGIVVLVSVLSAAATTVHGGVVFAPHVPWLLVAIIAFVVLRRGRRLAQDHDAGSHGRADPR